MKISHAELDEFELYLDDIADSTPLSREREVELAARIQTGDTAARDELVQANLRFVVSVAKNYQHCGLLLGELVSAGNLGLITAAERFDGARGFKFISYAVWWIRQAIMQAIAEQARAVRQPANRLDLLKKMGKRVPPLEQRLGRSPLLGEIAEAAETDEATAELLLGIARERLVSLEGQLDPDTDDGRLMLEMIPDEGQPRPDEGLMEADGRAELSAALACLDEREQHIIVRYYGLDGEEPMTLNRIGARIGLTRERVRQLKERALAKLRLPEPLSFLREIQG